MLVTGRAGYVGTAPVQALASKYEVMKPDKKAPRSPAGALTTDESVGDTLNAMRQRHGAHVISCVHLAAHYGFSSKPSPLYQSLTVEGTRRILRGLQDFQVEQFVFSRAHIVMTPAEDEDEAITESSPVEPGWDSPRSTLRAEQVIRRERGSR